jgi:MHS family proline/betaine transporter-like MFS transporter
LFWSFSKNKHTHRAIVADTLLKLLHINIINQYAMTNIKNKASNTKLFTLAGLGHTLELYDYALYPILLPILVLQFFPSTDPNIAILLGMLSFAVSFLIASIGSIFWGWYGDKFGRLKMLRASILLMALPSLIISIVPTYNQIGILAPIIIIFCRIIQGISVSAEVKGSKIFLMECLGNNMLGIASGFLSATGAIGVILATISAIIVQSYQEYLPSIWRVPFLIGSCVGLIGIFIRKHLTESQQFIELDNNTRKVHVTQLPAIIKEFKYAALTVFMLGGLFGVLSNTMHAFMSPFVTSLGYEKVFTLKGGILALFATMIFAILTGKVIDKYKVPNVIMICNTLLCSLITIPCFMLILSQNEMFCILAYFILGSLLGMNAATCSVIMYNLFPIEVRCRGIILCYTFGFSIFGGFTPIVLILIAKHSPYFPAMLITAIAAITGIGFKILCIQLDKKATSIASNFR